MIKIKRFVYLAFTMFLVVFALTGFSVRFAFADEIDDTEYEISSDNVQFFIESNTKFIESSETYIPLSGSLDDEISTWSIRGSAPADPDNTSGYAYYSGDYRSIDYYDTTYTLSIGGTLSAGTYTVHNVSILRVNQQILASSNVELPTSSYLYFYLDYLDASDELQTLSFNIASPNVVQTFYFNGSDASGGYATYQFVSGGTRNGYIQIDTYYSFVLTEDTTDWSVTLPVVDYGYTMRSRYWSDDTLMDGISMWFNTTSYDSVAPSDLVHYYLSSSTGGTYTGEAIDELPSDEEEEEDATDGLLATIISAINNLITAVNNLPSTIVDLIFGSSDDWQDFFDLVAEENMFAELDNVFSLIFDDIGTLLGVTLGEPEWALTGREALADDFVLHLPALSLVLPSGTYEFLPECDVHMRNDLTELIHPYVVGIVGVLLCCGFFNYLVSYVRRMARTISGFVFPDVDDNSSITHIDWH